MRLLFSLAKILGILLWPLSFYLANAYTNITIGRTIFAADYEKQQEVIREIHLYPDIYTARIFQNKGRIILDKYLSNVFALTDPNNYFFSFHPREDVLLNQNLVKFPFLAIIPILFGLLYINKMKHFKLVMGFLVVSVAGLAFIENFDRLDLILCLPLSLIFLHGMNILAKAKTNLKIVFMLLLLTTSITELIRLFFIYS